jgi:hypothetical protein
MLFGQSFGAQADQISYRTDLNLPQYSFLIQLPRDLRRATVLKTVE